MVIERLGDHPSTFGYNDSEVSVINSACLSLATKASLRIWVDFISPKLATGH